MVIICTEYEKEVLTQAILAHKNRCIFEEMCPDVPKEIRGETSYPEEGDDRWCAYCIANRIAWYIEKKTV